MYSIYNAVFFFKSKYQHWHLLFQTHNRCCQIHCSQFLIYNFFDRDFIILHCIWIQFRIAIVNSIYCFCKEYCFSLNFNCTEYSCCICRKIRVSCTACKKENLAFCKSFFYSIFRIKAGKGATYNKNIFFISIL